VISVFCEKHKQERREAWEAYMVENGIADSKDVSMHMVYLATKAVDTNDCEDGCGLIGLNKNGSIEVLKNPKEDWFLGHLLP